MKKILFATTAIAGLATVATPAMADALEMDLGGFYRGYGVYNDVDATRDFDLRHDAEIHFTGETTLDNGLTVGVHSEMELAADNAADGVGVAGQDLDQDEIYAYMSGTWGRINWGQEDGAAYLLQVAAPSADSNVDGLRTYIQAGPAIGAALGRDAVLDYAQDYNGLGEAATKITYLTPKFGGFQAGVSYAPELSDAPAVVGNGVDAPATDDDDGEFENLLEAGIRFDGAWNEVGFSVGGGYGMADTEADAAVATDPGSDDLEQWNAGINFQWMAFEFGGAYTETNNGIDTDGDTDTWVAGLGWNNGPYSVGATYLDREYETAAGDFDADRWTVGGTYTYGPGMTFRGAVAFGDFEAPGAVDEDITQVTLGTEINF